MDADTTDKQTVIRDSHGRFTKGHTYNSGGRKAGQFCKLISMARAGIERVLPDIIEEAVAGDEKSRSLLLQYGMPRTKPTTLPVELPSDPQGILASMASGDISPDVAAEAMSVHLGAARVRELELLEQEVADMKQQIAELKSRGEM